MTERDRHPAPEHDLPQHYEPEHYRAMGFRPVDPDQPHVLAQHWRQLRDGRRLQDIQQRYLLQQERAGQPLVDEGFIVGWLPKHGLREDELSRLLQALERGMAAGQQTLTELQTAKALRDEKGPKAIP